MKTKNGLYKVFTWKSAGRKSLQEFKADLEANGWNITHQIVEKKSKSKKFFGLIKVKESVTLLCCYGV